MATDFSDDDYDFRFRCEERTTKIFWRLHSLVQAGYVLDNSPEDRGDAFWLRHPSNKFNHNLLTVYSSGRVLSWAYANSGTKEFDFDLDDEAEFGHFLRQVPRPTWWDRHREGWVTFWWSVLLYGGLLLFGWIVTWVLKSIGRAFGVL